MSKASALKTVFAVRLIAALALVFAVAVVVGAPRKSSPSRPAPQKASPVRPGLSTQQGQVHARLGAMPLAFEANQGQTDSRVKYVARANGYTLFLTSKDAVFSLHNGGGTGLDVARQHHRHAAPAPAPQSSASQQDAVVRMHLAGAASNPKITSSGDLASPVNYYIGSDPKGWHTGVHQFSRVAYQDVYPGVNLAFHGRQRELEFDFVIAPKADPARIALSFAGAQRVSTSADGALELATPAGTLTLRAPFAYQEENGTRQPVDARFALKANHAVGFELGPYDPSRELVIDPTMTYMSYLGGSAEDEVFAITTDAAGNVYLTGESKSTAGFPGGNVPSGHGFDAFVTQLTAASSFSTVGFTTFFGGTSDESGQAIAVNGNGIYLAGITTSSTLPLTTGSAQPNSGGSGPTGCQSQKPGQSGTCTDGFVAKFNTSGNLVIATFVGGNNFDDAYALGLDPSGNVWVAGDTSSATGFPLVGALYSFNNGIASIPPWDDGFITELPQGLTSFTFSTYLGGKNGDQINGLAIDSAGNVYVAGETNSPDFPTTAGAYQAHCGQDTTDTCNTSSGIIHYDAFVAKRKANKSGLSYSTFIGGSSDDYAYAIALDSNGDAYITGQTSADNSAAPVFAYPSTLGAYKTSYNSSATDNGFVTELNSTGSAPVYSTFLGGSTDDWGGGIAVDVNDNAYVTGYTLSTDFPFTANAIQTQLNGNGSTAHSDAFVTQVVAGGATLGYSSFVGGSNDENALASAAYGTIALDPSANVWIGGSTSSTNLAVTSGAAESAFGGGLYDGFVAELAPDFTVQASSPSSVNPGATAQSTVDVFAILTYGSLPGQSSVTLGCSVSGSGSPAPACSASSFSPGSVKPTAAGGTSTLSVTTTGPTGALLRPSGIYYAWIPLAGLPLAGIWLGSSKRRRKGLVGFLLMSIVAASLLFLPACSSSSGGGGSNCTGCTPAGNYTVTVTGTDGNSVSHTAQFTVKVN